jgi:hypothetical protein
MGLQRTRTVKNKHAANKSGIPNSKASRQPQADGFVRAKSSKKTPKSKPTNAKSIAELLKKRKQKKTYTEEELGIPKLNSIRPAGTIKPRGKKKGKVFVDDAVGVHHCGSNSNCRSCGDDSMSESCSAPAKFVAETGGLRDMEQRSTNLVRLLEAAAKTKKHQLTRLIEHAGEPSDDIGHRTGRERRAD